ncbi:TasA family protein [Actinokineospora inagensis]|uniref:TasA family protein n=1 Tax=Actinokineospora inagensis TaxID=103730 RepID=UPI000687D3A6|nr:TasA family protein [Actinokineospora inagensis]
MTMQVKKNRSGVKAAAVVATGLVASALVIWFSSYAAFTATTTNSGNSFSSGSVAISDDDSNGVLFSVSGLKPGDTGSKCIEVTYNGSVASSVKLYTTAASYTGTLGTYLDFTVKQGTGGTYADCTGFVADSGGTIHNGTLAAFASSYTNFANGIGTWTPSTAGTKKTFQFTYTLQDNNSAQNKSAGIGFTWEAQSS